MVGGRYSLSPDDFEQFVNLLEFSFHRLMAHLRNANVASSSVNPWILLRTSAVYLASATCLDAPESPRVQRGIAACDEVVQAFGAIVWIKHVQLVVIPVLRQYRCDTSGDEMELWSITIRLMEVGVQSLVSAFAIRGTNVRALHSRWLSCLTIRLDVHP